MDEQINTQAKNLTKAIFQHESGMNFDAKGDNGTSTGAGQWQPATWKEHAKTVLSNENAPLTKENQSVVAQGMMRKWIKEGKNAAQIAAIWNSGSDKNWENKVGAKTYPDGTVIKYNVPKYVKEVTDLYHTYKGQTQPSQPTEPEQKSNVPFPSSPTDTGFQAGMKALGNTPASAYNFAKGIISSVNPINIVKNIGEIGTQFGELSKESGGAGNALINTIKEVPGATAETLVPQGIRQIAKGDIEGASKSFTEDPFGQTAPVVLALEGGAKFADKTVSKSVMKSYVENIGENTKNRVPIPKPTTTYSDAFGKAVEMGAKPVTATVGKIGGLVGNVAGGVASGITSALTSLNPSENATRGGLAKEFSDAIDNFIETKKDTGAEYGAIRTMDKPVPVPKNFIADTLAEFKLKLNKKGKVVSDTTSMTRNPADINAIQRFVDNWGKKTSLTPEEFLNMRSDISGDLAKFSMDKTTAVTKIGDKLYAKANETIGKQIPGLRELDAKVSPQIEQYKQLKKDFLNPDGTFKDGAINKIANATGKGKANLLARMEEIAPGIGKKIEILKAVEDIENANGIKVGSYIRGLITGGFVLTGNLPGILASIITSPSSALQILRSAGYVGKAVVPILSYLRTIAGDVPKEVLKTGSFNQGALQSQNTGLMPLNRTQTSTQQ